MKPHTPDLRRRSVLMAPVIAGLGWLGSRAARAAAPSQKASLIAKFVDQAPRDPGDSAWQKADVLELPMAPQAVVKPRAYEVTTKLLTVRALYDETRLALLLEWEDPKRNTDIGSVSAFRDAVAVQFPAMPGGGIPYFAMGEPNKPVTIYQWKADWEFSQRDDVDAAFPNMAVDWYPFSGRGPGEIAAVTDYGKEGADNAFHTSWRAGNPLGNPELQARASVEKLRAEGFGTLTPLDPGQQDAAGKGEWKDGAWRTVVSFPRAQETFKFEAGLTVPFAFAVWEGSAGERGGEKAVSTWYFLSLEKPIGTFALLAPVLALIGAAAAQTWGLRQLRKSTHVDAEHDE